MGGDERMINREITYERDIHNSYMKIPAVMESCLDEKLIFRREYQGILPVEKSYINGGGQYWYNISGRQALDAYCRVNTISEEFFEQLILRICSQLELLEWNLISSNCLVLDPEMIFINHNGEEISFVLYPNGSVDLWEELQQLMEYLLTRLNHSDKEGVQNIYRIYELILEKGLNVAELKKIILESKEKNKPKEEMESFLKTELTHVSEKVEIPEETDGLWEIESKLKTVWEQLKTSWFKKENKEEIPEVVRPEDEIEEIQPMICPTVCMASTLGETQGLLIYEGIGDYPDFQLEEDVCMIGKNPKVRLCIHKDTISQFHAKIDYLDHTYYIEDCNSTNGTYVNDEIINYKEKKALSPGDVIRFADVKYRFL